MQTEKTNSISSLQKEETGNLSCGEKINILGISVNKIDYPGLADFIEDSINSRAKSTITYANVHILNETCGSPGMFATLNQFDIIHPDGTGVYLASKILYGSKGLRMRFVGSDFFEELIEKIVQHRWKIFFLGDEDYTLNKLTSANPRMNIVGTQNGFTFDKFRIVDTINASKPDILFVGMGFPKQELWISENKGRLDCSVIIAVGEAIRVFSHTKVRGPFFIRKIGLEWLVRLVHNPKKLWKRYIFGNPLFLYRIFKLKLINLFRKKS